MTTLLTPFSDRPKTNCWREGSQPNNDAVTATTAGTPAVQGVASAVVAVRLGETGKMVGVVATTSAAGMETVVEAREKRRVLVVAQSADKGATKHKPTAAAAATAREEVPENGGTALKGIQHGTACPPPPARLRAQTRTVAK